MFNAVSAELTEAGMRSLAAAPLRSLRLDGDTLGDDHVAPLAGHPTLANLELGGTPITIRGARTLASLPQLRRLYVPSSALDDRSVAELAPLAGRLRSLHLGHSGAISDAACETLSTFDQLVLLDVRSTQITGAGIRSLARLHQLEHLDLGFLAVDDAAVRALAPLVKLRSLSFYTCDQITDLAIDTLEQLPALERLDLGGSQITARGIERLARLPHLRTLGLEDCNGEAIERARTFEHWYVNARDSIEIYESVSE
jgi:Leucine-rich repeat (LRR) protein